LYAVARGCVITYTTSGAQKAAAAGGFAMAAYEIAGGGRHRNDRWTRLVRRFCRMNC